MRHTFRLLLFLGIFVSIPLMATGPRISPSLISIEKNEIHALDLPPFISTEIENEGVLSELVISAFSDQNINVVINIVPVQSMLKYYLVEENAIAVMGRHLGIENNAKKRLLSVPLFVSSEHFIYYRPAHQNRDFKGELSNLKELTYGASKGEDVTAFKKASIKVKKSRTLSMFKKLKQGSVDFISLPPESVEWFLNQKHADEKHDFAVMPGKAHMTSIAIHFNLDNPKARDLASAFQQGLRNIINNGKYAKILKKQIKDPLVIRSQLDHINDALR